METIMCIGADTKVGCPYGAEAEPSDEQKTPGLTVRTVRYHCARCLPGYSAKYDHGRLLVDDPHSQTDVTDPVKRASVSRWFESAPLKGRP